MTAAEEAVAIHRRLVADDPGRHEPGLGIALDSLARRLAELDRYDEAQAVQREAHRLQPIEKR